MSWRASAASPSSSPGFFDFYPQTWNLPDDMARLQHALKTLGWQREALIVKPDDGSQVKCPLTLNP